MTHSTEEETNARLIQKALAQEAYFNQEVHADQAYLLAIIQDLTHTTTPDLELLQTSTLARIDRDLDFVQKMNTYLQDEKPAGATWALKINKMSEVLTGAKEILSDPESFHAIAQGQFPTAFEALPPHPVHLGDLTTPYGNSQVTFLSAALAELSMDLLGEKSKIQHIPSGIPGAWIDSTHIAHVTPFSSAIDPEKIDAHFTQDFSFYFSDPITPQGFAFIHSGYAFGGHRLEPRYEGEGHEKIGPEDCSSWISKLTECAVSFSTIEQLYTYRLSLPESERGYVDPNWIGTDRPKAIQATLSPVIIENPLEDIHAGQIFAFRTFATEEHQDSAGTGGHTALVLDLCQEGKSLNVVTLAFARNMPDVEGFGIQAFPWASDAHKETMFFNVLPSDQLPEIAAPQGDW